MLRGKVRWIFYDETGKETEYITLNANGEVRCLNVEKDQWHSLQCRRAAPSYWNVKMGCVSRWGEEVIEK